MTRGTYAKLGPPLPPRRITWQSGLPAVLTILAIPWLLIPIKLCGWDADCIASIATLTLPSVPFLKPIGKAEPEASSRCNWDSVVRAPIAPQVIQSAMNCGLPLVSNTEKEDEAYEMVSSSSHPTGRPVALISQSSSLAILKPLLIWYELSISGSLINPFHPTVVLGFSLLIS